MCVDEKKVLLERLKKFYGEKFDPGDNSVIGHANYMTHRIYELIYREKQENDTLRITPGLKATINEPQVFFYRAMSSEEAAFWLSGKGCDTVLGNGHQGFAQHISYSLKYMGNSRETYPILLEICAPDYIKQAHAIGMIKGSLEDGEFACGIGCKTKNTVIPDKDTNKRVEEERKNPANRELICKIIGRQTNGTGKADEILRKMPLNDKRKMINAILFLQSIHNIEIAAVNKKYLDEVIKSEKI